MPAPLYGVVAGRRWRRDDRAGAVACARERPSGRARRKQLFAFSILYLFLLFAVLLVDRAAGGCRVSRHDHASATDCNDKRRPASADRAADARRRARSIAIALALRRPGAVVFNIVTLVKGPACWTGRCETKSLNRRHRAQAQRAAIVIVACAAVACRHDGRRCPSPPCRSIPVLPGHRLRRPTRRDSARRRQVSRPHRHRPLRHQCRAGPAVDVSSPCAEPSTCKLGERHWPTITVTNKPRAPTDRPGRLQCRRRRPPAPISTKLKCFCFTQQTHEAGRRANGRWCSSSIPRSPRIPNRTTSTRSPCPTPSIRCAPDSRRRTRAGSLRAACLIAELNDCGAIGTPAPDTRRRR